MDVLIIPENNSYTTTIYKKPTATNLYLLYDSNQPRKYKLGLIRSLYIRILRICSNERYVRIETNNLFQVLHKNGYPENIIKKGIKETIAIHKKHQSKEQRTEKKDDRTVIFFTLSYYGQETFILSQKIKKLCKKLLPNLKITIAFKNSSTLGNFFLPKQKGLDNARKHKKLVYSIQCKDCTLIYGGETNREKETRINEHIKDITKNKQNSAIAQRCSNNNHQFDLNNTKTLNLEENWKRRIIKESLLTQKSLALAINDTKYKLKIL